MSFLHKMKPLGELKVVNLALNLPGPSAARRLMKLGASITKIEPPTGDPMEHYHVGWYRDMADGQTVVRLDLKTAEGKTEVDRLLAEADLIITAYRPAAMERLSLDWNTLHRRFPRLCQVAILGYPAPRQNEAGHDLTYQASLGLITPPHLPRTLLADMAGTEQTVSASLALLLDRERHGEAGYAEVTLAEAAEAMAEPLRYGTTAAGAILGGGVPEYNIYKTAEGWVAVAALEPHFRERLEMALEVRTAEEYAAAFLTKSATAWQQWGQELDLPVVAVAT